MLRVNKCQFGGDHVLTYVSRRVNVSWLNAHFASKRVDNCEYHQQVHEKGTRQSPPGQLGPTSRERDWLFKAFMTCNSSY